MSKPTNAEKFLNSLSDQLTEERLAEVRSISGFAHLERGALTDLIKEQSFSVEDIVTLLMSGWMLQTEEINRLSERVVELEDICSSQKIAIDEIADQSLRLRHLLGSLLPDQEPVSSFEVLKSLAAQVDRS